MISEGSTEVVKHTPDEGLAVEGEGVIVLGVGFTLKVKDEDFTLKF